MEWLALFFGLVFCGHGASVAWFPPSLARPPASAREMKCVTLPPGACTGRSMAPPLAMQLEIRSVALVVLTWLVLQNKGTL